MKFIYFYEKKHYDIEIYAFLFFHPFFTQGIMGIFFVPAVQTYTSANIWLFWVAFFLSIGFLIGLVCCGDVRRKSPHNMILLSGFTVAEGFMLGVSCSTYSASSVLLGMVNR